MESQCKNHQIASNESFLSYFVNKTGRGTLKPTATPFESKVGHTNVGGVDGGRVRVRRHDVILGLS